MGLIVSIFLVIIFLWGWFIRLFENGIARIQAQPVYTGHDLNAMALSNLMMHAT